MYSFIQNYILVLFFIIGNVLFIAGFLTLLNIIKDLFTSLFKKGDK